MAAVSTYIGLFTGLLISGMGIYLYLYPIESGFPAWVRQGLPFFMIGYGAIRFGFSLYKLLQKRSPRDPGGTLLILLPLALIRCSQAPEANLRLRFDYAGDCSTCPITRMDSVLRVFFPVGIVSVSLDTTQHQVLLDLDSNQVRVDTLRQVLLAYGYEIDEEISADPVLSPCCIIADVGSGAGPLAGPGTGEIQEDMTLLERELEQELGVNPEAPQLNLDSELNLDEDLGLDELDLEGGIGAGEDFGLDELDMEMDLDLDMEDARSKKPAPKKP